MSRTFNVRGVAKCNIILRGCCLKPRHEFNQVMSESDLEAFKDDIEVLECQEILPINDTPITQKSENVIEIKKEAKNVRKRSNTKTATKSEV